jgi:hypothetical protein
VREARESLSVGWPAELGKHCRDLGKVQLNGRANFIRIEHSKAMRRTKDSLTVFGDWKPKENKSSGLRFP